MSEDEIRDLIKRNLSVQVFVSCGGEDVEVQLFWAGEHFHTASDNGGSGDQGGPQA